MDTNDFDYDQEVEKIEAHNQPILDGFQTWLEKAKLAPKTVSNHLQNIAFFAEYLTYYEPLYALDEADAGDVCSFLLDWFPRKAMWASVSSTKSHIATFRKFFKFMQEADHIDEATELEVRQSLKERKDEFIEAVAFDDDNYW